MINGQILKNQIQDEQLTESHMPQLVPRASPRVSGWELGIKEGNPAPSQWQSQSQVHEALQQKGCNPSDL